MNKDILISQISWEEYVNSATDDELFCLVGAVIHRLNLNKELWCLYDKKNEVIILNTNDIFLTDEQKHLLSLKLREVL